MIELTYAEQLLLAELLDGPKSDRDCTPERVLVNSGFASRIDIGQIEITAAGVDHLGVLARARARLMTFSTATMDSNMTTPAAISNVREQREAVSALTKIAAECHRAKWQFDLNGNRPNVSLARDLVAKAFDELHRIGDMAMKLRDALSTGKASE